MARNTIALAALIALGCGAADRDADFNRRLDLAFSAPARDTTTQTLARLQHELFDRLTRVDDSAARLVTMDFMILDEAAPPAERSALPSSTFLTGMLKRFEPGTLPIEEVEVLPVSEHRAFVMVHNPGRRPSVTRWELRDDGWRAASLQLNASERTVEWYRDVGRQVR